MFVKLDVNYADNPKIAEVGEAAELAYVRILCLCKRMLNDGKVTRAQLKKLGLPRIEQRVRKLCSAGLLTETGDYVFVTGWFDRNRSAAELTELHENRASAGKRGGERSAQVRWGKPVTEAPVNGKQVAYTVCNPETETETETETISVVEGGCGGETVVPPDTAPSAPPPKRKNPAIPLTAGWMVPGSVMEWAVGRGFTEAEINREHEKFKLHAQATDRRLANWDAGFRNWLLKSREFSPPGRAAAAVNHNSDLITQIFHPERSNGNGVHTQGRLT